MQFTVWLNERERVTLRQLAIEQNISQNYIARCAIRVALGLEPLSSLAELLPTVHEPTRTY